MIHRVCRILLVATAMLALIALPVLAQVPTPGPTPSPVPATPSDVPIPSEPIALPGAPESGLATPTPDKHPGASAPKMTLIQAAIIGVVEGITEYLPVSSTGHIILTQRALGIGTESKESKEAADAFAVSVQAGAIVAVLGLYFGRVKQGFRGLAGKDPVGLKLSLNLLAAFVPALVLGALLSSRIKEHLFGLWPITLAWFVGGVAILYVTYRKGKTAGDAPPTGQAPGSEKGFSLDVLNWQSALLVGLAQCLAMWPGTSRSLVTIVAGVLVGMSLTAAVEFSFLLGVITLTAATVKDLHEHGGLMLELYGPLTLFVGFLAAFISAVGAIEWLVGFLKKHSMAVFGYYRVALSLVVAGLLLAKILQP